MKGSYQRIICLLLLTAMVFIGSCQADVTSTRLNLKEGLRDTLRILRLSTKIPKTNYRTIESILKRLVDYDAPVEHLTGLPDSNGSGAEETKSKTLQSPNIIFETLLEDACKWAKTKLTNSDQKLNCSDENSFMEGLMPVAVTMVANDIKRKMEDLHQDTFQTSTCKWFFCTFKCGNTTVSEQQYNYMANKLGHYNCDNKSCDECR